MKRIYTKQNINDFVIELMTKYHARKILEIGCGMDPIFLAYPQYEQMTIVEPATIMYESAVTHAKDKKKYHAHS